MSYLLRPQEMASVSGLPAEERLRHFIKRIADWEEVWSLRNQDGWVLSSTNGADEIAPFWSHPDYARACATGQWIDCEPAPITLEAFQQRWLPGMSKDHRSVAVFSTPHSAGLVLSAETLSQAIQAELDENYS